MQCVEGNGARDSYVWTRAKRCVAVLGLAILAGCAGTAPAAATPEVVDLAALAAEWPVADGILQGFPAAGDREHMRAGDRALFGVRTRRGDEVEDRFLLVRAVEDESTERAASVSLELVTFAADGRRIGSESVRASPSLLHGAFEGCRLEHEGAEPPAESEKRGMLASFVGYSSSPSAKARFAMASILGVVQESDELLALVQSVAAVPPVWELVSGVHLKKRAVLDHCRPATWPAGLDAYSFPVDLLINDQLSLRCAMVVVPSTPPYRTCGGFVGLVGVHPHDDRRSISVWLLAAATP